MESIVTRHIANKLLAQSGMPSFLAQPQQYPERREYKQGSRHVHLTLRHCYRWSYSGWIRATAKREVEFTGGIVYEVRLEGKYEHNCQSLTFESRLKPGWTKEKLAKRISRAVFALEREKYLWDKRERLYDRWTKADLPDGWTDKIDALREESGITDDYSQMDEGAIAYWDRILRDFQEGLR